MASRSNQYQSPDGKEVWKELENINRFGYGYSQIFSDWIDLALNSLLSLTENFDKPDFAERVKANKLEGIFNDRYMAIVRRYRENESRPQSERPIDYFTKAWNMAIVETREKQQDILGQIFTERVTFGEAGQFFTPTNVTDLMTRMSVEGATDGQTVLDPCCGSGRFLISASKVNPNLVFYGQDIDIRCAKMAALNLWLFDLNGVARCGDSLREEWHVAYEVARGGYVWEREPSAREERQESEPPKESEPESPKEIGSRNEGEGQMKLLL